MAPHFYEVSRSHTQRRTTVGRTPLNVWSVRRRDLSTWQHTTITTDKHPCPPTCWGFLFTLKNPTAVNLGTKGQHATSRPPKPKDRFNKEIVHQDGKQDFYCIRMHGQQTIKIGQWNTPTHPPIEFGNLTQDASAFLTVNKGPLERKLTDWPGWTAGRRLQ